MQAERPAFPRTIASNFDSPAVDWESVTPSDTNYLRSRAAIFVGTGGTVVIESVFGNTAPFVVGDGTLLPVWAVRVLATGTDADDIVALYWEGDEGAA